MAIYAIGDVQGCLDPLQRLLDLIRFDPGSDTLWFAGDLVNRGPRSLDTLRYVMSLGDSAISVLGNHDLHLLALHSGLRQFGQRDATLAQVLDAADAPILLDWLRRRPLLHIDDEQQCVLVHAGIHPLWPISIARALAREIEEQLASDVDGEALRSLYGPSEGAWLEVRDQPGRLRYAVNCFTRMRFCSAAGVPDYLHSGAPGSQPPNLLPWFSLPRRPAAHYHIIFGHWAALGLYQEPRIHALDSGCVWGNALSAMRISDFQTYSVSCP